MTMTAERADIVLRTWYRIAFGGEPEHRNIDRGELSTLFEALATKSEPGKLRDLNEYVAEVHAEHHRIGSPAVPYNMSVLRDLFAEIGWKPSDGSGASGLHECDSDRTHAHSATNQEHTT